MDADKAIAAAEQALDSPYSHYEAYWIDGLPSTAAGLQAAVTAGVPLRAVVWLHQSSKAAEGAGPDAASAASSNSTSWPDELLKLQSAVAAAPWDSWLASLLLLAVPIGDTYSPFTAVPAGTIIANPPWAAAASAAAAMRATAAEVKPPPSTAGKPAAAGARGNSGSGAQGAAKPGTASAGTATAGAAASSLAPAGPEDVPGCKEIARAVLTVRDQARVFDQWMASVRVYLMPKPQQDGYSMSCYEKLLSTVPPERTSVPVLLHAILEQVQTCSSGFDRLLGNLCALHMAR